MAKYEVHYDSNDGNHRWWNCTRVRVGLRWVYAKGVEGNHLRIARRTVQAIVKNDG